MSTRRRKQQVPPPSATADLDRLRSTSVTEWTSDEEREALELHAVLALVYRRRRDARDDWTLRNRYCVRKALGEFHPTPSCNLCRLAETGD